MPRPKEEVSELLQIYEQAKEEQDVWKALDALAKIQAADPYEFKEASLQVARPNNARDFPNDGRWEAGTLTVRSIRAGDGGDPPDFGMFRHGPDGVGYDYDGDFSECPPGTSLGSWYWTGWNPDTQWDERSAQITGRYQGRGKGSIHIFTNGNERWVFLDSGRLDLTGMQRSRDAAGQFIECIVEGVPMKLRLEAYPSARAARQTRRKASADPEG